VREILNARLCCPLTARAAKAARAHTEPGRHAEPADRLLLASLVDQTERLGARTVCRSGQGLMSAPALAGTAPEFGLSPGTVRRRRDGASTRWRQLSGQADSRRRSERMRLLRDGQRCVTPAEGAVAASCAARLVRHRPDPDPLTARARAWTPTSTVERALSSSSRRPHVRGRAMISRTQVRSARPPCVCTASTLSPSIGLPVHLSHAFITTVSAAFVPSAAQRGRVRRATDKHQPPCVG